MGCLDFITDSVLRLHRQAGLTEDETRFYTACIVLGLEAMHQRGILHRSVGGEEGQGLGGPWEWPISGRMQRTSGLTFPEACYGL